MAAFADGCALRIWAPPRAASLGPRRARAYASAAMPPRPPRRARASVFDLLGDASARRSGTDDPAAALGERVRALAAAGAVEDAFAAVRRAPAAEVGANTLDHLVAGCADSSQTSRAFSVVRDLFPKYGAVPTGTTYVNLVRACGRVGDISRALGALSESSFGELDSEDKTRVYACAVDAAARCGALDEAFAVVERCKKEGVPRSELMYASLIRGCARSRPLYVALGVLRSMTADNLSPATVETYNALLEGCARAGRLLSALSVVSRMQRESGLRPDLGSYNALLACCGRARDPDKAFELLATMKSQGIRPAAVSYNSVVVACAAVGDVRRAIEVATVMRAEGIRLNVVTYNNLLEACCNANSVEQAFTLTKEMIEVHNVRPNSHTYNTLIRGCGKWGKLDAALRVLTSMRSGGVSPTVVTYSVAIAACARSGGIIALGHAFDLVREMRSVGVLPNVVTYNSLLHACARAAQSDRAFQVLEEMKRQPITPDTVTLCSLVDACGRAGDVDAAFRTMTDLLADFPTLRPNVPAYNALIHACYKAGSVDRMSEAFKSMRRCGLRPNVVTYSTFVAAYAASGDMDRALGTIRRMRRRQLKPNQLTYTSVVAGYGRLGLADKALDVLEEARANCGMPDEELYTAAIVASVRGNRVEKALALAEEMKLGGHDLPKVLDRLMLRDGAVEYSGDELADLLRTIEALGIRPTRAACESLVSVYAAEGNVPGSFGVLPIMTRLQYPPNLSTYKKLIECCGLAADLRRAQRLFSTLRREGRVAGRTLSTHHWVQLYEAILTAIVQVGDTRMGETYLAGMKRDCGDIYAEIARRRVLNSVRDSLSASDEEVSC